MLKIGIIGGTGIDSPDILENKSTKKVTTPFGDPASELTMGKIKGVDVVLISRHGPGHKYNPTHVPYQANIWALKQEGCTHILAPSAVGSLQEDYKPGDIVFTDQFIDRTTKREQSFYDKAHINKPPFNRVCHISVADPTCAHLRVIAEHSAKELKIPHHTKGTIVVIEGPRFSTKAESNLFRSWNAHIIGMTSVPEAVLAREAEMCYLPLAMVTDYDCWKDHAVSLKDIVETMAKNIESVKQILTHMIPRIKDLPCSCRSALEGAFL